MDALYTIAIAEVPQSVNEIQPATLFSYESPERVSPKVVLGITLFVFIAFTLVFEFAYKGIF